MIDLNFVNCPGHRQSLVSLYPYFQALTNGVGLALLTGEAGASKKMLRIQREENGRIVLRVNGRLDAEELPELKKLIHLERRDQRRERGVNTMQPGIRIVKRETRNRMNSESVSAPESERQRERKNVDTVKGWISEWERRKRQLQSAADALIAQCVVPARERRNRLAVN